MHYTIHVYNIFELFYMCFEIIVEHDKMNLNDLEEVIKTLAIGIEYDYKQSQPLQPKPHFL